MNDSFFLDPDRAGVFFLPPPHWEAAQTAASDAQRQVLIVQLKSADREEVLRELGTALHFPDWYGANLDALYDCLTDLDQQPAAGQAILISGLGRLHEADPDGFSILVEVLRSAAEARLDAGVPLWIFLDFPATDIPELPRP